MNRNIIIRKSITEDKIFKEPKTMQVMWYVLLNADKEQKLKTTYLQITCITGLSKPATEKALESLKNSGYISKRVSGKEISLKIKKDFPYLMKRKTQDCFKVDGNTLHFDWFNEYQTRHLWVYLLLKANTEPVAFKSTVIDKGELMTKLSILSTATGLTVSQVRTALKKFADSNCIEVKTTNKYSIIKIVAYESYI
ncbi:MAG: hypothetical protein IKM66_00790 [Clostridia bacterium]|nr:hypothetical protein [Clostridia bacterium]